MFHWNRNCILNSIHSTLKHIVVKYRVDLSVNRCELNFTTHAILFHWALLHRLAYSSCSIFNLCIRNNYNAVEWKFLKAPRGKSESKKIFALRVDNEFEHFSVRVTHVISLGKSIVYKFVAVYNEQEGLFINGSSFRQPSIIDVNTCDLQATCDCKSSERKKENKSISCSALLSVCYYLNGNRRATWNSSRLNFPFSRFINWFFTLHLIF